MKLTIKNLQAETFTVDCDADDTIKQLKEKIAAKNDLTQKYDPELLKLLYTGKVMDDDETVESYSIKPESYLVLVKQTPGKPKPPPKKKPNQGLNNQMGGFGSNQLMQSPFQNNPFGNQSFQPNAFGQHGLQQDPFSQNALGANSFGPNAPGATSFGQNPLGQSSFQSNKFEQQSHSSATGVPGGLEDTPPESFTTAKDREEALETLIAMGFDKKKAEQALRASFYNVETAIDYITSGNIPKVEEKPVTPAGTGPGKPSGSIISPGPQPTPAVRRQGSAGGMGANLQQMRQMLQEHPEQLQVIKHSLQADHPEIAKMIDENPQAFLELLNQASASEETGPATGTGGAGGVGGGQGSRSIKVELSTQEQEIINRLQEMGFERNRAIEAFLACDRNENYAVNYLLNSFE